MDLFRASLEKEVDEILKTATSIWEGAGMLLKCDEFLAREIIERIEIITRTTRLDGGAQASAYCHVSDFDSVYANYLTSTDPQDQFARFTLTESARLAAMLNQRVGLLKKARALRPPAEE